MMEHGNPILNMRISVCRSSSPSVRFVLTPPPPEIWNRLDWRALVESCPPNIRKLRIAVFAEIFFQSKYFLKKEKDFLRFFKIFWFLTIFDNFQIFVILYGLFGLFLDFFLDFLDFIIIFWIFLIFFLLFFGFWIFENLLDFFLLFFGFFFYYSFQSY